MKDCDACHKPAWACAECLKDSDPSKRTRADRIRSMTDKEIVEFLSSVFCAGMVAQERGDDFQHSFPWTLDWLRQPAEE